MDPNAPGNENPVITPGFVTPLMSSGATYFYDATTAAAAAAAAAAVGNGQGFDTNGAAMMTGARGGEGRRGYGGA